MAIERKTRMVEVEEYITSDGTIFRSRQKAEEHERKLNERTYLVTYHFSGEYVARVQASNAEEAMERARKIDYPYPEDICFTLETMEADEE